MQLGVFYSLAQLAYEETDDTFVPAQKKETIVLKEKELWLKRRGSEEE